MNQVLVHFYKNLFKDDGTALTRFIRSRAVKTKLSALKQNDDDIKLAWRKMSLKWGAILYGLDGAISKATYISLSHLLRIENTKLSRLVGRKNLLYSYDLMRQELPKIDGPGFEDDFYRLKHRISETGAELHGAALSLARFLAFLLTNPVSYEEIVKPHHTLPLRLGVLHFELNVYDPANSCGARPEPDSFSYREKALLKWVCCATQFNTDDDDEDDSGSLALCPKSQPTQPMRTDDSGKERRRL